MWVASLKNKFESVQPKLIELLFYYFRHLSPAFVLFQVFVLKPVMSMSKMMVPFTARTIERVAGETTGTTTEPATVTGA